MQQHPRTKAVLKEVQKIEGAPADLKYHYFNILSFVLTLVLLMQIMTMHIFPFLGLIRRDVLGS